MNTFRWIALCAALAGFAAVAWFAVRVRPHDRDAVVSGPPPGDLATLLQSADPARGARLFGACAACHPIGRGAVDRDGPSLHGVFGAPVAARRPRFAYTAALRRFGGVWSTGRLDAWLTDPAALVPGTSMRFPGLPDPRDRADIIAYLARQGP